MIVELLQQECDSCAHSLSANKQGSHRRVDSYRCPWTLVTTEESPIKIMCDSVIGQCSVEDIHSIFTRAESQANASSTAQLAVSEPVAGTRAASSCSVDCSGHRAR
ncbi:hypothetical protein EVAR_28535_1 [Eumeta japonica]|uniref:Uncharacterized protein n=1 Tax=Eumeta variegata TaxID=151549 RepID=A0A4C1UY04_EUMVA|nr:hypothetical protein EVAR_28535_1 [Eumeta japonica]